MSSEILREALNDILNRVAKRLDTSRSALRESEEAVECAQRNLQEAKLQEHSAIHEDKYLRDKIKELNGLLDKSQLIIDEIVILNSQQSRTFDKSQMAHMLVEQYKREVSTSESDLRMSQHHYDNIMEQWQDVTERIKKLQH